MKLDDVRICIAMGDPLLLGFGGGVNSVATLILLRNYGLRPQLVTFANTRGEKPGTYAYLAVVEQWLHTHWGLPLTQVVKSSPRTGDESLEAESLRRETLPSRAFGMSSCAMRWKIEPQEKFLNHWPPARECWARGRKPIKVLGYDGGEQRRASVHDDDKLRYWYPLLEADLDRDACIRLIESEGLPVPPKSACFYCPSSTKAEVLWLAEAHPDLFARAVKMEETALGNTRYPLREVKGLGRHWAWKDLVQMAPAERTALLEQPVEACTVCVEEDRNAP
jgi:hypothetical protein